VLWLSVIVLCASVVSAQGTATAAKSVGTGKTAVTGSVSDPTGETYGVVGISNSPDGAGLGAANTNGGPDLVLDGTADGQADTLISQAGIDRPSATTQTFTLGNTDAGGLDLIVEGILFGNGGGLTGVDAALLGGSTPGEFALDVDLATSGLASVHWDNITDGPSGLADGDDDTLGGLPCGADEIARWSGSSWVCSEDLGVVYARTYVVGPVGTPSENGAALLAAIAAIPTPASRADARLLEIEPGTYDVGATPFEMKSWVDVEGSGEEVTLITGSVCESSGSPPTTGLVIASERAGIRQVTIENTCAGSGFQSVALFNEADYVTVDRVSARASGAADINYAIHNNGYAVNMHLVTAVGSGATSHNEGGHNSGSNFRATRSSFTASGGAFITGFSSIANDLTLVDVTAAATNATTDNSAISLTGNAALTNVTATASGGVNRIGIDAYDASFRMEGGNIDGSDGIIISTGSAEVLILHNVSINATNTGLFAGPLSSVDVYINNSSIRGATNSISIATADVFVGGSQLAGGPVLGGGVTCAGVWDEAYVFSASTCP
jgi:hypothetical protein